ncbi:MAG: hypothetical protein ACOYLB_01275 [Phototrophicaceae bacterium]
MSIKTLLPSLGGNQRIILCEGKFDFNFIDSILSLRTNRIDIYPAHAVKSLAPVRAFLEQGIIIRDRDFKFTVEQAQDSFTTTEHETIWKRYDIEGYLLYADWIQQAFETIQSTRPGRKLSVPSVEQIEAFIIAKSREQILHYAGNRTVKDLHPSFSMLHEATQLKVSDPTPTDVTACVDDFTRQIDNLRIQAGELDTLPELQPENIAIRLQDYLQRYDEFAQNMDTIRIHFSGKKLLEAVWAEWLQPLRIKDFGKDDLSKELIPIAKGYATHLALLRDDERLGDFALLGEKSLADGTAL